MVVLEPRTTLELTNAPPQAGELVFDTSTSTLKYSVDGVVIKTIADSNLVGPIGINTSNPDRTLEINETNGQVLRLTYGDNNGDADFYTDFNIASDGKLTIDSSGNEILTGTNDSFNIQGHDGSTIGLKLDDVLVTSTANELNYLSGITAGTATASKALVLDSSKTISGISSISTTGLTLNSTEITASGTQINYNNVVPGTATASKTMVLNEDKDISGINSLSASQLSGTIQTAYQPLLTSVDVLDITEHNGVDAGLMLGGVLLTATATQLNNLASGSSDFTDVTVAGDLTITNHNGSDTGLVLGNTLVTATGAELNTLDLATPGQAENSKALVLDQWGEISGIDKLSTTNFETAGTASYSVLYNWNNQGTLPTNTWCSVAYSPSLNIYVAIASNNANTNAFASSTDGFNWTQRTAPAAKTWNHVIWIEEMGLFYAVSNATSATANSFAYSSNGTSWTGASAPTAQNFTYIEYLSEKSVLMASAENNTTNSTAFYYSFNGTTWANTRTSFSATHNRMSYLPGFNFYITLRRGDTTGLIIETGPTLRSNAETTGSGGGSAGTFYNIALGANNKNFLSYAFAPEINTFVTVATDLVSNVNSVVYSTNGTTFTPTNASEAASWFKVIWIAEIGLFVAISSDATPKMMTSPNGITWSSLALPGYIPQLSNIVWFKETSALVITSLSSGQTYSITQSIIRSNTNFKYMENQTYSNNFKSLGGDASMNLNSGLFGTHRFLYNNPSNTPIEIARITTNGMIINAEEDPISSLDLVTNSVRNNNKVLRLKNHANIAALDFEVNTSGRFSSVFSNPLNLSGGGTFYMDHRVEIGNVNGGTGTSSTTTGQLVVNGGVGISSSMVVGSSVTTTGVVMSTSQSLQSNLGLWWYFPNDASLPITGSTPTAQFWDMVWSEEHGIIVATTSSITMLYSTNGYTWTSVSSGNVRTYRSLCYAKEISTFIALAEDTGTDSGRIITSTNGTTWTTRTMTLGVAVTNWSSVDWSPKLSLFVACAKIGNNQNAIATSPDGITWTQRSHPATVSANPFFFKVYWNAYLEHFIICGYGEVFISTDGINWTMYNNGFVANVQLNTIAWSPVLNTYIAATSSENTWCRRSTDGMTWSGTGTFRRATDIKWIKELNLFFVVDGQNSRVGSTSADGTTWNDSLVNPSTSGGFTVTNACYVPMNEMLYVTRSGATTANQNLVVSRNISISRLNLGRNPYTGTMYGIDVRSSMTYYSGYYGGHKFYNSLNGSATPENLLVNMTNRGIGVGNIHDVSCRLDITNNGTAGEIARFRYNNFNYASMSIGTTGGLTLTNTTAQDASSSTVGGVLTITGGTAISKKLYVGDGIYGTIQTASQPNITTVGTLTSLSVDGVSSIEGTVVDGDGELNPLTITTKTSSTPANGITTGINFGLENSANVNTVFGKLEFNAQSITSGSESGAMSVKLMSGGNMTERLTLTNDGVLGGMLYVQETSDRRVKENIIDADPFDSYDSIMKVQIKDYNFIGQNNTQRGFIAQELKEIIPNAVEIVKRGDIDDFHTVKTRDLVCYLIQTVQVMDKKIKKLESMINEESFAIVDSSSD